MNLYKKSHSISLQGVIQDFEVEGGNKKSNQKMLLKKGQLTLLSSISKACLVSPNILRHAYAHSKLSPNFLS